MCYSAQVWEDYHKFIREFGAQISIQDYVRLYVRRNNGEKIKITKAMDASFSRPEGPEEEEILALIQEYDRQQMAKLEAELFAQTDRKLKAEIILLIKPTKKLAEDLRIASKKIPQIKAKMDGLRSTKLTALDSFIFPEMYAPVMIWENGKRVVKPMRYKCLPAGKRFQNEVEFPNTYNARRESLDAYWKTTFGYTHGIMVVKSFYENVTREINGVQKSVRLEFKPSSDEDMYVACLWSHWQGPENPDLYSFAAITDTPPPEIAAAGHDRCIIPIKKENIDAWLNPDPKNLAALHAILDDRERPYYEHQLAA
jgi:putative SOS response-associated peptidase YedK